MAERGTPAETTEINLAPLNELITALLSANDQAGLQELLNQVDDACLLVAEGKATVKEINTELASWPKDPAGFKALVESAQPVKDVRDTPSPASTVSAASASAESGPDGRMSPGSTGSA